MLFYFTTTKRYLPLRMIKKFAAILFIATSFCACVSNSKKEPVTDTDVATAFIRAVLDNDLKAAEKFISSDDTNRQYFETFSRQYQQQEKEKLEKYKAAEIIINSIEQQSDSVTIVNYSNSYQKDVKTNLKLVNISSKWLVDFKYTIPEKQ